MTTFDLLMNRITVACLRSIAGLTDKIYERHADRCEVCCVLSWEFCRAGALLQDLIDALDA